MTPVFFKCIRSGNLVSFTLQGDIDGMRKHEGYKEVLDVEAPKTIQAVSVSTPDKEVLTLKSGRSMKSTKVPSFLQE